MSKGSIFLQYVQFLREEKKYWVIPMLAFIVLGLLMAFAQSSAVAPFIYTLF